MTLTNPPLIGKITTSEGGDSAEKGWVCRKG
ncbi:hypothetical protein BPODLACK_00280 [Gordonia sp. YY1]|nr:hypothetical protein BPODLACK_00280 [Gordonia sp. YY1]